MLTGYATVAGHDDIIRRERSTLLVHDVRIGCAYHCLVQGVLEPLSGGLGARALFGPKQYIHHIYS